VKKTSISLFRISGGDRDRQGRARKKQSEREIGWNSTSLRGHFDSPIAVWLGCRSSSISPGKKNPPRKQRLDRALSLVPITEQRSQPLSARKFLDCIHLSVSVIKYKGPTPDPVKFPARGTTSVSADQRADLRVGGLRAEHAR
jgi:hypothetical protein